VHWRRRGCVSRRSGVLGAGLPWTHAEIVPPERGAEQHEVNRRHQPPKDVRLYDMLRPVEDGDTAAGWVMARAHRIQTWTPAECLGRIQHAKLLTRVVEPILQ
jgi:hypothetical protein